MADTNMDIKSNPEANAPVFEFRLPQSEVDMELQVGELGTIVIPVEVVSKADDTYTFRKTSAAVAEGNFRPETLSDARKRLIKKQEEEGDEDEADEEE